MRKLLLLPFLLFLFAAMFVDAPAAHASSVADMGVYDRGHREHAQGTVNGNQYNVVRGDTIFSISRRFGVSQEELMWANGVRNPHFLRAGSVLTIPGLGPVPPPQTCTSVTITSPTSGAQLGSTFTVSGRASGQCTFTVRALDSGGRVLREAPVTVNSGAGANVSWAVTLNVGTVANTSGSIVAVAGSTTWASVPVRYVITPPPVVCSSPALAIDIPLNNERVGASFVVRGTAGPNCTVTVTALDGSGRQLANGGPETVDSGGNWSLTLTVNAGVETFGRLEARSSAGGFANRPVIFGGPVTRFLDITNPTENASLPATFTVSGRGAGLFEGNVVVRAVSDAGVILFERATTLQGSNVGAGGEGTFSMQVTINTTTAGRVEAFNTESGLRDSVRVFFNGGGGPQPQPASYHDFQPNQCQVTARVGAPSYSFPDGPAATPFATGGTFSALRGVRTGSGEVWFLVDYPPGASVPDAWVRASDLSNQSGTCSW